MQNKKNNAMLIGVSHVNGVYYTQIKNNGKRVYLGQYETPEDAARAYNIASRELTGAEEPVNDVENPFGIAEKYRFEFSYVHFHRPTKTWAARPRYKNKSYSLGYYPVQDDALKAVKYFYEQIAAGEVPTKTFIHDTKKLFKHLRRPVGHPHWASNVNTSAVESS
jgi:hypothetical protein